MGYVWAMESARVGGSRGEWGGRRGCAKIGLSIPVLVQHLAFWHCHEETLAVLPAGREGVLAK